MGNSILKLSQEQEDAMDITRNIVVSAGAGSGKTRVLTNRYLRLLEDGIEIQEIVAITFTEKAALEMKERIRSAINEKLESASLKDKRKWQESLDKLSRANISTIHSFCAKVIRENAASLGIDFKFNIINEIDKKFELSEAVEESLEQVISSGNYEEILNKLADAFGEEYLNKRFKNELIEITESIFQKGRNLEDVYKELKQDELADFVLKILLSTEEIYKQYKLKHDALDYTDLEVLCNKVLEDKRVRSRYKKRYTRFLVDEFQDTSEIQKNIIYSFVADESGNLLKNSLFVVGDSKQSIYGFRGTDHTISIKVAQDIGDEGQKSLSTCYRSKPEIIYGINEIFSRLIDQYENLKVPNEADINEKRLILLTYQKEKSTEVGLTKKVKQAIENKTISIEDFKYLLDELKSSYDKVEVENSVKEEAISKAVRLLFDKGLKAKDICILVRSKYIIADIEQELKKYNIPYCVIGGRGFYNKVEIQEILNLYEIVINGFNEEFSISFEKKIIKALRSFIFNIPDDILYKIKVEQMETKCLNYFEAIGIVYDGMKESVEKNKLEHTYLTLLKLTKKEKQLSAVQVLTAIIEDCSIKETVLMQQEDLQKYRNIEKLLYEAEKFDKEELFESKGFVEYITLLNDNNFEDSEASLDSEDTEAVKIMTIHQSKGLEFEGVIVPEMNADQLKISKDRKNKKNLVYHDGKIISQYSIEDPSDEITDDYKIYFESKLLKEVEESIRVLYVALTRAKQYAVMIGEELSEKEKLSEVLEDSEKTSKLNSFMKQVLYPFEIKGADSSIIEFLDTASIPAMYKIETDTVVEEKAELSNIKEKVEFKSNSKIRSYVSASKYMKYKKCPRRYYIDSVLNIKASQYENITDETTTSYDDTLEDAAVEMLEIDEQAKDTIRYLKSSDLGTIVHKIIEYKNSDCNINDEHLIEKVMSDILGEDNVNSLEDKTKVKNKIKSYIKNYELIEKNRECLGELVLSKNEASFLVSPLEDRKTMMTGFIDRLEVFNSENKNISVITDYKTNHIESDEALNHLVEMYSSQLKIYGKAIKDSLYIEGRKVDEVRLKLYFLEKGICVDVPYNDETVDDIINDMDSIFGRQLEELKVEEFSKAEKEVCEECGYREMCLVI